MRLSIIDQSSFFAALRGAMIALLIAGQPSSAFAETRAQCLNGCNSTYNLAVTLCVQVYDTDEQLCIVDANKNDQACIDGFDAANAKCGNDYDTLVLGADAALAIGLAGCLLAGPGYLLCIAPFVAAAAAAGAAALISVRNCYANAGIARDLCNTNSANTLVACRAAKDIKYVACIKAAKTKRDACITNCPME